MFQTNTHTMYQVDAFTSVVFKGNPAAVLVLEDWLSDDTMLSIAQENNLAETAFARPNGSHWDLRWFTPVNEADFCGHATLATAHVLFSTMGGGGPLVFNTRVGQLSVSQHSGIYALSVPSLAPEPLKTDDPDIAQLIGYPGAPVFRNFENYFVVLPGPAALRAFLPDLGKISTLFPRGLCITSVGDGPDFLSRYFAPGAGIPEDPVTGSTHATLVPYWAEHLGRTELSAHQTSARGGDLQCTLEADRVVLRGGCATFMKAEIFLPA
ncbi:MAG: PhzF family phenazine biosynthesis protein [Pseudomonadota bacterium]